MLIWEKAQFLKVVQLDIYAFQRPKVKTHLNQQSPTVGVSGLPNFVIQEIFVLTDKFNPPKGFSLLNRTADSEQKAWKKKQLCYKLVNLRETNVAVTDIIVCSRLKKAPEGFKLAG